MKILFVSTEVYPFIKTGGLADVAYALPKALARRGEDIRVILPKYSQISQAFTDKMTFLGHFTVQMGWRSQYCGLFTLQYEGVIYYFIDNEYYFKRGSCYGHYDDGERFIYFCRAVLEACLRMGDFEPDILHCNDWHTGLVPVFLRDAYDKNPTFIKTKTVFTIHNLKYQGIFSPALLTDMCGLSMGYFTEDKLKYNDGFSFMKGGIVFADRITTVSETYRQEIQTPFYGEGLDGLLQEKSYKLTGITNGIDYETCNPMTDPYIVQNYSWRSPLRKKTNKLDLQAIMGLPEVPGVPVVGFVSRLVKQKGIDLIACVIEELLQLNLQMVVLGSGEKTYQDFFEYYAARCPEKMSVYVGFSEKLASKIYAGADLFLMPSLFEPCGISQMISLRYGTLPIVRETGGLRDTVRPYNEFTGEGNGFSFSNFNAHEMLEVIRYALRQYENTEAWQGLVRNAMRTKNDWDSRAENYLEQYQAMI